ncbi:poly-gamma-glutamate biosynthesis protein PgsC/CapC [Actinokineospora globicatena]|uniref:PGA biosynthesis protein CapC n=1 Tax=Actinokineospora globicatena TaxID=103729 RepID=A0A9W6QJ65_9PSEU|nr:poly-gamma-glutamate biosynthesis protein PgsC/CapC [Actinokineospora globicatena]MCP2303050.1 poly-gamma-glutamate biosynthesis protein PgsC/CapC [Actinokineospora globicatena]GLW79838.1 PGA biosynthesis protein CapC [Actinokineospora globicatena]GLW85752.1 PGA biosynthesis protein CapC [Actinokineospora globicatena]GLW90462.1 PGA biosynthesis protein CapC [Actinokineospora globicatena]
MNPATLAPEVATLGLAIGLVFSLACYLTTNLSPGGMITPGWLGLTLVEDYRRALIVVVMSALTFGVVKLLQRVVILYGKRLFAAVVLTGVLLQTTLFLLIQSDFPLLFSHQTLGFVVPGLIAYQLVRQPPVITILATSIVSAAGYGVLASGVLAGLVPTV